ncbi:MAG: N-acetyltransferase [Planctomycetales bacterium]|nr:N-acetyltransferase [Planctomycetales bacterium]
MHFDKSVKIRAEIDSDREAVYRLTVDAFEHSDFGHNGEAELINAVRSGHRDTFSLVAVFNDKPIGYLLCSPCSIETQNESIVGMAIGPVAVASKWQKRGVGTLLMEGCVQHAIDSHWNYLVVAGHPDFYARFKFELLSKLGLKHCFAGMPDNIFFIRFFKAVQASKFADGQLRYCAEFGPQNRFEL